MIQTDSLTIGYGSRKIVEAITFSLNQGESLLIIGHNGAGKTTLLRTLYGLLPPLSGTIDILDLQDKELTPRNLIQGGARFLGQGQRAFPNLTVAASREILSKLYGLQSPGPPLHQEPQSKRIGDLSSGQQRLEALHLLTAGSPRLYFLDEPTAGADPEARKRMLRWIATEQQKQRSFVIVEQAYESLFDYCQAVMVLRAGRVTFFGEPEELRNKTKLLETYL